MKNLLLNITFLVITFLVPITLHAQTYYDSNPKNNPQNYIRVDFDDAFLEEVVFVGSEYINTAFVFADLTEAKITWMQPDIYKQDIISVFTEVISALGLTCQLVNGSQPFYLIKKDSLISDGSIDSSVGIYHLKNVSSE